MVIRKYRRSILSKAIAVAVVCLFLVNNIAFGISIPSSELNKSALAPPLATKPLCEIVRKPDGSFDVVTNTDVIESWDRETVRSYKQGLATSGKAFRNRWAFTDVGYLIGQMLILTQEHKLQNPKDILIPLIKKHIRNRAGEAEILLEGFDIDGIEEVREGEEIIGFSLPITRNGTPTHKIIYNLQGGDDVIQMKDGTDVARSMVEKGYITAGKNVLSLGSGNGNDELFFSQYGCKVLATDNNADILTHLEHKAQGIEDLSVQRLDVEEPFAMADSSVDVVYVRLVLHYLNNASQQKILNEICRVLKPRGIVVIQAKSKDDVLYREGTKTDMGNGMYYFPEKKYSRNHLALNELIAKAIRRQL